MSFNANNSINLSNYEEWLLLYTDGELQPAQMNAVDIFLQAHPQLLPELEAIVAAKLPSEETIFLHKEELLASAMKAAVVDETLLLYVDNELATDQNGAVEIKLATDSDYALQHQLLMQAKVDASEVVLHPNKSELYRHTEKRVVFFQPWMRVAAAVLLLILGSLFFLMNKKDVVAPTDSMATSSGRSNPVLLNKQEERSKPDSNTQPVNVQQPQQLPLTVRVQPRQGKEDKRGITIQQVDVTTDLDVALQPQQQLRTRVQQSIAIESQHASVTVALKPVNKTITPAVVTTALSQPYNRSETTQDVALSGDGFETNKKTPARGFFRKVSRFIERRTGIGTVNADNELVIGAVALKLK